MESGAQYAGEIAGRVEDKLPPPLYELRRTGPACHVRGLPLSDDLEGTGVRLLVERFLVKFLRTSIWETSQV